jgi:hypothetical protein
MGKTQQPWVVMDKGRFLAATMTELAAASARISFEGDLGTLKLASVPGASETETPILKRNTLWPRQDFIVLPLEPDLVRVIVSAVGGTIPRKILHIQIEKDGRLELGIYDNPTPDSTFFGPGFTTSFLHQLQAQNIIKERTSAALVR